MEALKQGSDVLFILLGAIMVLAMHSGFAFLELGTVRKKNQVNALVKNPGGLRRLHHRLLFRGYAVAYGTSFLVGADQLVAKSGYELVKFFFLLTFAAAIPAIISGGIAERARFGPQLLATAVIVGLIYPVFEGIAWNQGFGIQAWIKSVAGEEFHDFAGSIVVHAVGGWLALPAVLLLGARANRYRKDGGISAHPPSSIPFLALGAWILTVGWFGFNVMSAQTIDKVSGLVAVNSLMANGRRHHRRPGAGPQRPRLRAQRPARGPGGGLRRQRPDASARRPGDRRRRGRDLRGDVHADAEPLEDRRRAGRLAAARPVRAVGRHRGRDLRQQGVGRAGRRELPGAADRQPAGRGLGPGDRLPALRPPEEGDGLRLTAEEEHEGADLAIHKIGSTPDREVNW